MEIPYRKVQTAWGALYATPTNDGMRFSTRSPRSDQPDTELLLDWRYYTCELDLSLAEPADGGRVQVDDQWSFSAHQAVETLVRLPYGGTAPIADQLAFQRQVVPALVEWLYSPAAQSLFHAGRSFRRRVQTQQAATAEQALYRAIDRVQAINTILGAGDDLGDEDRHLLRLLSSDLPQAMSPETQPAAPDRSHQAPSPTPPQTPPDGARGL